MKLNSSLLKCFGFCLVFCAGLCFLPGFFSGCNSQKTEVAKDNKMQTITNNDTPFACNMAALNTEEKKRVLALLSDLKTKHQEIKEFPDGYAFRYAMDNQIFKDAAEFVTLERHCCPFFEFALSVEKDNGAMWLQLKGREGVKEFIKLEFDV